MRDSYDVIHRRTEEDLETLAKGEWLNDKVINVFMKMINVRSAENIDDSENTDDAGGTAKKKKKKKKKKKTKKRSGGKEKEILNVHAFSTFFYNKLKGHGIDGVKRWTKKASPRRKAERGRRCGPLIVGPLIIGPIYIYIYIIVGPLIVESSLTFTFDVFISTT